jgi:hypothetical protein
MHVFTKTFHCSHTSTESILRSRPMMISGRLLSKENIYMFVDESSKTSSILDTFEICSLFFFPFFLSFKNPTFQDM